MADFQVTLFSCFQDFGICLIGWIAPCYLMAINLARVDGRECVICDCCCMTNPNWVVRQRIRVKYGFQLAYCGDCLTVAFCQCCTVIQHANEMKAHEALVPH